MRVMCCHNPAVDSTSKISKERKIDLMKSFTEVDVTRIRFLDGYIYLFGKPVSK